MASWFLKPEDGKSQAWVQNVGFQMRRDELEEDIGIICRAPLAAPLSGNDGLSQNASRPGLFGPGRLDRVLLGVLIHPFVLTTGNHPQLQIHHSASIYWNRLWA